MLLAIPNALQVAGASSPFLGFYFVSRLQMLQLSHSQVGDPRVHLLPLLELRASPLNLHEPSTCRCVPGPGKMAYLHLVPSTFGLSQMLKCSPFSPGHAWTCGPIAGLGVRVSEDQWFVPQL